MSMVSPIRIVRKRFGVQVFLSIAALVLLLTTLTMILLTRVQNTTMISKLENSSILIAQMLAYQVRIGLFAENDAMLDSPMESSFQNEMVLSVSLFDHQGELVAEKNRSDGSASKPETEGFSDFIDNVGQKIEFPAVFHTEEQVVVWEAVRIGDSFKVEDSLYASDWDRKESPGPIGYVKITLGKQALRKQLKSTRLKTMLLGLMMLAIGAVISFFLARHITRPIQQLTQRVSNFGESGRFESFQVKSQNEIGQLAVAFQEMIQSLKEYLDREVESAKELAHNRNLAQLGVASSKVTHEVGNLLNNIGLLLPALKSEVLSAKGQKRILLLERESVRLRTFISDFLQFAGKPILQVRTASFLSTLEDLLAVHRSRAAKKGIVLALDWPVSIPPITADHRMLSRAIDNLVVNSLAVLGDGGKITLIGRVISEDLVVMVEDDGPGIEPALMELIFEPFFTTKDKKGTGLGLSIVKGIVQGHGGSIVCESSPGKGARFVIRIPTKKIVEVK